MPLTSGTLASEKSGVPVPLGLLYRLNVTVPVGLKPPLTVALSAMDVPTVAVDGCWVVLIDGVAGVTVTGSAASPLLTELLLLSHVTVPVGLKPPLTVAVSAMLLPTVAVEGCWLVVMAGVAGVTVTG